MNRVKRASTRAWDSGWRGKVVIVLIFLIAMALVGFVWGKLSSTAFAAEQQNCTYDPGQQCTIDAAHWSKRKFTHGKMGHVNGVTGKQLWARPKAAKRVFVHKFEVYLNNHPNYGSKTGSERATDLCFYKPDPENCRAHLMYRNVLKNTTCAHAHKYQPYTVNSLVCNDSWTDHISQKQVKRYGTVIVCGGALAVAVAGAPETAGSSLVAAAGAGSVSCFWGFLIGAS